MTQELVNAGLGLATTVIGGMVMWGFKSHMGLRDDVTRIKNTLSMMSEVAARALHSPDDHLGLDEYLDIYAGHDCEMPYAKWEEMKAKLWLIINDTGKTAGERNAAGMLLFLSYHKLNQPLPPIAELWEKLNS